MYDDVRSVDFVADPYPALNEWRRSNRVLFHEASKMWFLLHYDDVSFGLADVPRSERFARDPLNPFALDGPVHTLPRRVLVSSFSNRSIQKLADRTQAIVDAALASKKSGDVLCLVDEIGYPLPYLMMCDLLGVPRLEDVSQLRDDTFKSLALIDAFLTSDQRRVCMEAAGRLYTHIGEVVAWKRDGRLGDDLVSLVVSAADEGEVMRDENVVPFLNTLYLAGMHTTVNQTSLSLLALMKNRDQWELLVANPDLVEDAVEELLRYQSTAQYMIRNTQEDYTFGDVVIPAESRLVCWISSANRDEAKFGADADALDITRRSARHHIAFGKGPHVCIGSWLARLELKVVLRTLVERYPKIELADDDITWAECTTAIRGPDEVHLVLN